MAISKLLGAIPKFMPGMSIRKLYFTQSPRSISWKNSSSLRKGPSGGDEKTPKCLPSNLTCPSLAACSNPLLKSHVCQPETCDIENRSQPYCCSANRAKSRREVGSTSPELARNIASADCDRSAIHIQKGAINK